MAWQALNFTTSNLTTLKNAPTEYWVKDAGGKLSVSGLAIRVYPSGTKKFYLVRRIGKRTVKMPLGTLGQITHVQAREKAQLEVAKIVMTGIDPLLQKKAHRAEEIDLSQAFEGFLESRGIKSTTATNYRKIFQLHLADWAKRPLIRITRDEVLKRYTLHSKKSASSANSTMRLLRALFNHADGQYEDVHGNRIRFDNPVDQLSKNKAWLKEAPRTRRIKRTQFPDWFEAVAQLEPTPRDYLTLLLFTGLRRREASSLRWKDIDFTSGTLTVVDTKNGKPLTIPLSSAAVEILTQRHGNRDSSPWVFPSTGKSGHLEEPKKAVAKIAGLSGVTASPHDLRRTFVSIGESAELSPYVIKRLVNHSSTDVTEIHYIEIELERLKIATQSITDIILSHSRPKASGDTVVAFERVVQTS